jgi:hypothetical protein
MDFKNVADKQDVEEKLDTDNNEHNGMDDTASVQQGSYRGGLRAWAKALSVETGGIQRVTDDQRQNNTTRVWNACTFW